jgi:hypothetical protein
MELLKKLSALFTRKPVIAPPTPLYADEEFLEFVAAQTRKRTLDEQQKRDTMPGDSSPLGNAA